MPAENAVGKICRGRITRRAAIAAGAGAVLAGCLGGGSDGRTGTPAGQPTGRGTSTGGGATPTAAGPEDWVKHQIDAGEDYTPLHVTTGDFFGNGHRKDVAAGAWNRPYGEGPTGLYLYSYSNDWERTRVADGEYNNVRSLSLGDGRDELLVNRRVENWTDILAHDDGWTWTTDRETKIPKSDDRMIPLELTGEPPVEVVGVSASSESNGAYWLEIGSGPPYSPERHLIGDSGRLPDLDGVEAADLTGDGRMDLIVSASTDSPGVYWYEQGETPTEWTEHVIDTETGFRKIEGNDAADFDGDGAVEVVTLDQKQGMVFVSAPDDSDDPTGTWSTAAIDEDAGLAQCSLDADLTGNGRSDLIYTYESGGVAWLTFDGADVLDPADWTKRMIVESRGAWWIAQERRDLSGNGKATDIVIANRVGRSNGDPQIYWLEPPASLGS